VSTVEEDLNAATAGDLAWEAPAERQRHQRRDRHDHVAVGPDGLFCLRRLDRASHAHPSSPRALLPGEYDVVRRLAEGILAAELPARKLSVDKARRLLRKQGLSVRRKQVEKIMADLHAAAQVARTRAKDIAVNHPAQPVTFWTQSRD
jgi:hypothetical protein